MSEAISEQQRSLLGKSTAHSAAENYEAREEFADQGDIRVVKALQFPYHVISPSPMLPGQEVIMEVVKSRGDVVSCDEMGLLALEKGERLGAFFTTEELAALKGGGPSAGGTTEIEAPNFTEWGEAELAEYIRENKPDVNATIAMAGNDADTARRLLEAENIATDKDPRSGVVKGLTKIVGERQ